jgi:hypothetical protein
MASVSGSQLTFVGKDNQKVNFIVNGGKTVTGSTVHGSDNIEIFTAGSGPLLPGVDGSLALTGPVTISGSSVLTPGSTEQLGSGAFQVVDNTGTSSFEPHRGPTGEDIMLGTGAQTVVGSRGDTVVGGNAGASAQVIDLSGQNSLVTPGPMTAIGGAGALTIDAGSLDSIVGGSGPETISGGGAFDNEHHGNGHGGGDGHGNGGGEHGNGGDGHGNGQGGGNGHDNGQGWDDEGNGQGWNGQGGGDHDDDSGAFGLNTIIGGSGPMTILGGQDDSIVGSSGSLSIEGGLGGSTIEAGTGGTTVDGAPGDSIGNFADGKLLIDINDQNAHGGNAAIQGGGAETISLGADHGATTLRDVSVQGGQGSEAGTTVTGFSPSSDVIASATSVNASDHFIGTSKVSGNSTILTFKDGSTMTLAGITDIGSIKFTQ